MKHKLQQCFLTFQTLWHTYFSKKVTFFKGLKTYLKYLKQLHLSWNSILVNIFESTSEKMSLVHYSIVAHRLKNIASQHWIATFKLYDLICKISSFIFKAMFWTKKKGFKIEKRPLFTCFDLPTLSALFLHLFRWWENEVNDLIRAISVRNMVLNSLANWMDTHKSTVLVFLPQFKHVLLFM